MLFKEGSICPFFFLQWDLVYNAEIHDSWIFTKGVAKYSWIWTLFLKTFEDRDHICSILASDLSSFSNILFLKCISAFLCILIIISFPSTLSAQFPSSPTLLPFKYFFLIFSFPYYTYFSLFWVHWWSSFIIHLACWEIPSPPGGIRGVDVKALSVCEEGAKQRFSKGLCSIFCSGFAYIQHKDPIGNRVYIFI